MVRTFPDIGGSGGDDTSTSSDSTDTETKKDDETTTTDDYSAGSIGGYDSNIASDEPDDTSTSSSDDDRDRTTRTFPDIGDSDSDSDSSGSGDSGTSGDSTTDDSIDPDRIRGETGGTDSGGGSPGGEGQTTRTFEDVGDEEGASADKDTPQPTIEPTEQVTTSPEPENTEVTVEDLPEFDGENQNQFIGQETAPPQENQGDILSQLGEAAGGAYTQLTGSVGAAYETTTSAVSQTPVVGYIAEQTEKGISDVAEAEEQLGEPITGPPGAVESGLGKFAQDVESASDDAVEFTQENIGQPVSDTLGTVTAATPDPSRVVADAIGQEMPEQTGGQEEAAAEFEGFTTSIIRSTVGAPGEAVRAGEMGAAGGEFAFEQIEERGVAEGVAETGEVAAETAPAVAQETVRQFQENPTELIGGVVGGFVTGTAASRAVGKTVRKGIDYKRTAGGTEIDIEDVTNPETVDFFKGETTDPDARFPGAQDPDLYQSDPPEAVRQQAEDMTPANVREQFEEAGVEGVTLKKGLDVDPEGPGTRGFETQPGSYESPGAFVGPELSPNFLGIAGESGYSLRPGLPDFGNRPTGVFAKTDVKAPEADNLPGLREEVLERSGETTAVTKPSGTVSTGEIEAIIPPEARFTNIGDSSVVRRFGIGSDYYTTIAGRRVPVRLVRPDGDADVDVSDGATGDGQTLAEITEPVRSPSDDPLPVVPSGGPVSSSTVGGERISPTGTPDGTESGPSQQTETEPTSPIESPEPTSTTPPESSGPSEPSSGGSGSNASSGTTTPFEPSRPGGSGPSEPSPSPSGGSPPTSEGPPSTPGSPATPSSGSPTPSRPPLYGPPSSPAYTPPTTPPTDPTRYRGSGEDNEDEITNILLQGRAEQEIFTEFRDPLSGTTDTTDDTFNWMG